MTQPAWPGDRMSSPYPAQRRDPNLSSYTMPTPYQQSSNVNQSLTSPAPYLPPIETPYGAWRGNDVYFGRGGFPMSGGLAPGVAPNQHWMSEHMTDPNRNLSTLNSAANIPNHMPTTQNGSSFSSHPMQLPGASSSEQLDEAAATSDLLSDIEESSPTPRLSRQNAHKGRPRVGTHRDTSQRKSAALGKKDGPVPVKPKLVIKWRKGLKEEAIPEDATEERTKWLKEYNTAVGEAKKNHTREQNRKSASDSRLRRKEQLEKALAEAQLYKDETTRLTAMYNDLYQRYLSNQRLTAELRFENSRLTNNAGTNYGAPPQGFNSYSQLPVPNAPSRSPMSALNAAQYPTPMPGPASSPAAVSARNSSSAQFGSYMQTQAQGSLSAPNQNTYQNMPQTQDSAQAAQNMNQAQSGTTQMGFDHNFAATSSNAQAPAYEQQQGNPQGNLSGNVPEGLQNNPQDGIEESKYLTADPLGDNSIHEGWPYQEEPGQSSQEMFEGGPIDPDLQFASFGSPRSPTPEDPPNAGS